MSEIENNWHVIYNPGYEFNDNYGLTYLSSVNYNIYRQSLSFLRKVKEIDGRTYYLLGEISKHHFKNSIKIKELDSLQPRLIAQKFIGKKDVRTEIFNRDGNLCLNCKSPERLTIDHIMPISKGGDNHLDNLQTLCKSCNSRKRDKYIDYRNG